MSYLRHPVMVNQVSITQSVPVDGVNVYNGRKNKVTFHPAEENSGLAFIVKGKRLPATLQNAVTTLWGIGISDGNSTAYLTEHVLSAVYALGIDNIDMELSDRVCPTTDYCAVEFFDALRPLRAQQSAPRPYLQIKDQTELRAKYGDNGKDMIHITSGPGFTIDYVAYYPHLAVQGQRYTFKFDESAYAAEIAGARSPAFTGNSLILKTFLLLGKWGIHGLNERNFLLVTSKRAKYYANSPEFGVRYDGQEFVRHKVLDVIGELALSGRYYQNTKFQFQMTGHMTDIMGLKQLMAINDGHSGNGNLLHEVYQ
jgi:UDP-3-O-[3-hydroxymyristoyl] N-acetylglucosamine deacetylase